MAHHVPYHEWYEKDGKIRCRECDCPILECKEAKRYA